MAPATQAAVLLQHRPRRPPLVLLLAQGRGHRGLRALLLPGHGRGPRARALRGRGGLVVLEPSGLAAQQPLVGLGAHDPRRRPVLLDTAFLHDDDAVEAPQPLRIGLHDDDARAVPQHRPEHELLKEELGRGRVDGAEGVVQQRHRGGASVRRPSHGHPRLLPAGQGDAARADQCRVPAVDDLEIGLQGSAIQCLIVAILVKLLAEEDVLLYRALRNVRDLRAEHHLFRPSQQRLVVRAFVGEQLAQHGVQDGALPRADLAQHGDELALRDVQREAVEHGGPFRAPPEAAVQADGDLRLGGVLGRAALALVALQAHPLRDLVWQDQRRLGQLQKGLHAPDRREHGHDPAQGRGENLAHAPQAAQDHHASEDGHHVLVPIDGRVPPKPGEDKQAWEAEHDAIHDAQVVVPPGQASHLLRAEVADALLHGLLPSVALYHPDPEEHLPQGRDATVNLALVVQHAHTQPRTAGHGEHHSGDCDAQHDEGGDLQAHPEHGHQDDEGDEGVDAAADVLEATVELLGDVVVQQRHEVEVGHRRRRLTALGRGRAVRGIARAAAAAVPRTGGGQALGLLEQSDCQASQQLLVQAVADRAAQGHEQHVQERQRREGHNSHEHRQDHAGQVAVRVHVALQPLEVLQGVLDEDDDVELRDKNPPGLHQQHVAEHAAGPQAIDHSAQARRLLAVLRDLLGPEQLEGLAALVRLALLVAQLRQLARLDLRQRRRERAAPTRNPTACPSDG
mmetsp:Transcript_39400/g.113250  ORF Transcript_39400/g.113250 Transcript_39400/m.113250 type:complete len:737 (-) Transcript_39400:371-2581(-)